MSKALSEFRKKAVAFFNSSGEVKNTEENAEKEAEKVVSEAPKLLVPPQSKAELVRLLRRCDASVLSDQERNIISATMMANQRPVSDIMLPKKDMTFVHDMDFLGPLTLDKLYQSGYEDFPVLGPTGKVIGVLNTRNFNNLSIKETDRVIKYLSHDLSYIRSDHNLVTALNAFLRTNHRLFLVVDKYRQIVGMITLRDILEHLLGGIELEDDFEADGDIEAVSKRDNIRP